MLRMRCGAPVLCAASTSRTAALRCASARVHRCDGAPPTDVQPPMAVPRTATSVLEALASTVKRDATAQHYSLVDDPFLMPKDPYVAMRRSLARQQGKMVARQIAAEYPTLFQYDRDQPRLDAFRPTKRELPDPAADCPALSDRLDRKWILNAMDVYENAVTSGQEVSADTKLRLFSYLAFYNSADPPLAEGVDEQLRWYQSILLVEDASRFASQKPWQSGALCDLIFEELKEIYTGDTDKMSILYSAMIAGLVKFQEYTRATRLFDEMCELGLHPFTEVYVAMVDCVPHAVSGDFNDAWQRCVLLLNRMCESSAGAPNAAVFAAVLRVLVHNRTNPAVPDLALKVLGEAIACGVEPTLELYNELLHVYEHKPESVDLLDKIVSRLEQHEEPVARSPSDGQFYVRAMDTAAGQVDAALAKRLFDLFELDFRAITNCADSERLHSKYLLALSATGEPEDFVAAFLSLVPSRVLPSFDEVTIMLENVEMWSSGGEHMLSLWPRITACYMWSKSVMTRLLRMLASGFEIAFTEEAFKRRLSEYMDEYVDILRYKEVRMKRSRSRVILVDEAIFISSILLRCGESSKAVEMFNERVASEAAVQSRPKRLRPPMALLRLADSLAASGDYGACASALVASAAYNIGVRRIHECASRITARYTPDERSAGLLNAALATVDPFTAGHATGGTAAADASDVSASDVSDADSGPDIQVVPSLSDYETDFVERGDLSERSF